MGYMKVVYNLTFREIESSAHAYKKEIEPSNILCFSHPANVYIFYIRENARESEKRFVLLYPWPIWQRKFADDSH